MRNPIKSPKRTALLRSSGVCDQKPICSTVDPIPIGNKKRLSFSQEGILMGQKLGSTALVCGAFFILLGVCFVPAAFSERHDQTILGAGICAIAFGSLLAAGGFYLKARTLQASGGPGAAPHQRSRGGCAVCKSETPVVLCRVHNVHICGTCLAEHYDFRSCVYIPSTRRQAARAAKASS